MEQINLWSQDHIAEIVSATMKMDDAASAEVLFDELCPYSQSEKSDILKYLHSISRHPAISDGMVMWLENTRGLSVPKLKMEHHPVGTMSVKNGRLTVHIPPAIGIMDESGLRCWNQEMDVDMTWILFKDIKQQKYVFSENGLSVMDFDLFYVKENAFIVLDIQSEKVFSQPDNCAHIWKKIEESRKLFAYSPAGILEAIHYAKTLLESDEDIYRIIFNPCYVKPYMSKGIVKTSLWFAMETNKQITIYHSPAFVKNILREWAENEQWKIINGVNQTAEQILNNSDEIGQVEVKVHHLQSLLDLHHDEISRYAVSKPYSPEDRFHVFFASRTFSEDVYLARSEYKNDTNEIPLDWGSIPEGAVFNAYQMLNKIQAYSKNPVSLSCIAF